MALFEPEFGLVFWMLVVFLILLGILAKFAWPMILRSVEERADFIDKGVQYAQEAVEKRNRQKKMLRLCMQKLSVVSWRSYRKLSV